jgi:hypothetical protein
MLTLKQKSSLWKEFTNSLKFSRKKYQTINMSITGFRERLALLTLVFDIDKICQMSYKKFL